MNPVNKEDFRAPSPNNPQWSGAAALVVWLASVVLILFLPLLFVMPYLKSVGFSPADTRALGEFLKTDTNAIVINIVAVFPAHVLTLAVAWLVVTKNRRYPFFKSLGWEWGGFKLWHGAAILIGFFAVSSLVTHFIPEQEHELMRILKSSRAAVYAVAFLATFTAPLVEEVVYRGVLYSAFQKTLGKFGSVVLVTFLFAVIHVPQYMPSYATIILIFVLSLTLTMIRVWTDNLLPCVALHLVFNGLQSIRLVADPLIEQMNKHGDVGAFIRFLT